MPLFNATGRTRPNRADNSSSNRLTCLPSLRKPDFKVAVAETVVQALAPVRERYLELAADRNGLERVLADGAERARAIASDTVKDVRERMGVGPPG